MNNEFYCIEFYPFILSTFLLIEGVVAQWCNPLQSEQSGGVGSNPGRTPSFERNDKGSRTRFLRSQRLALKTATSPSRKLAKIQIISVSGVK